jgi:hypothetical protein
LAQQLLRQRAGAMGGGKAQCRRRPKYRRNHRLNKKG